MLTRSFKYAGSFNYHYGFSINRLSANLGPRQLGYDFEVFTMKTVNILWGVGNRYSINKSWFIGIDWLRIYFPIYSFENGTSSISKARDLIKNAPTFTILALELGYKF